MKTKQHTLWLLAALAAPIAHYSGSGWLMSAAAALSVLPLTRIPKSWEGLTRGMAFGQILWLGVVAGFLLPGSAACWPSEQDQGQSDGPGHQLGAEPAQLHAGCAGDCQRDG